MTDVLDELREMLCGSCPGIAPCPGTEACSIMADVDTFAEQHPGLVDLTVDCCNCGLPTDTSTRASRVIDASTLDGFVARAVLIDLYLCPACAKAGDES